MRIEGYGLIGDMQSAALVGRNGSVDGLCLDVLDVLLPVRPQVRFDPAETFLKRSAT